MPANTDSAVLCCGLWGVLLSEVCQKGSLTMEQERNIISLNITIFTLMIIILFTITVKIIAVIIVSIRSATLMEH